MEDPIDLPVSYNNQTLIFKAWLITTGYTHKFKVLVNEQELLFEPDEERNYRVLVEADAVKTPPTNDLLAAIVKTIEDLVR